MKMKCIALLSLTLLVAQAQAAAPVVIDSQSIGNAPAETKDTGATAAQPATKVQTENEAARERLQLGGKISRRERAQLVKAEVSETNKTEGGSFLASNGAKKGVTTLPSGVQYRVIRAGKGKKPTANSSVVCKYKGTLINGDSFDMSEGKKPAVMRVSGFLAGVKEAVMLMTAGSKWEIVVPPQQAFGASGNRGVGPNAVVVYQMEILSIK
jgi:FKBP-type peptidyl-prolyl cis-trans isomerase FklB